MLLSVLDNQDPVVQRPINANQGFNFYSSFLLKRIFSVTFKLVILESQTSQIVGKTIYQFTRNCFVHVQISIQTLC